MKAVIIYVITTVKKYLINTSTSFAAFFIHAVLVSKDVYRKTRKTIITIEHKTVKTNGCVMF